MQLQARPTGRTLRKEAGPRVPSVVRPCFCSIPVDRPTAATRKSVNLSRQPLRLVAQAAATQAAPRCANEQSIGRFLRDLAHVAVFRSDQSSKMATSQIGLVGLAVMGQVRLLQHHLRDDVLSPLTASSLCRTWR